jgi:dGTPase
MRSPFQRDRDRIIHSTAFRRLTHKTQVFIYHEGDHFRTRLTHSIEVAQVARSVCRQLGLDEDLAEALALAHDLGHPPFGHAGERALQEVTAGLCGFDHNAQSLRVVTVLERKYATFDGLNLTWETIEGLVKHNGPLTGAHGPQEPPSDAILDYDRGHPLELERFPSAEAQVAALADDIAYLSHDIDDGVRAGLLSIEHLREVALIEGLIGEVEVAHADLGAGRQIYEVNRRLITRMIEDLARETRARMERLGPASADDIRGAEGPVAAFSGPMAAALDELKSFLFSEVWRHERVMSRMRAAEAIVRDLFGRYIEDPAALPESWRAAAGAVPAERRARMIVDFVAGMTDRYAISEHQRLFSRTPDLG